MRPPRAAIVERFLARHGWDRAQRSVLAADASFRTYDRLADGSGRRAVLMNAPPTHEDVQPFLRVGGWLARHGYSAPAVLASDPERGLVLLEDLGDDRFTDLLAAGRVPEATLYRAAVDTLVAIQQQPPMGGLAPYDRAVYLQEAGLFLDWFLPALTGTDTTAAARDGWTLAWDRVWGALAPLPPVTVLRDYHADNLMWLPNRVGVARVGLLDFQDALAGHPVYDLVSLLEDARRDVDPGLAGAMVGHYAAATGRSEAEVIAAMAILGAQRNLKIVGIFTRLWRRDGKPRYLDYLPRVWRLIAGDLAHPALAPVAEWMDRFVPDGAADWRPALAQAAR